MKKFLLIWLFAIILLFPLNSLATCIIIFVFQDEIIVVADTRSTVSYTLANGKKGKTQKTIEKIHHVGQFYFAAAGHDGQAQALIGKSLIDTTKLNFDFINAYGEKMKAYFTASMERVKKTDPEEYNRYKRNGIAETCFFGYLRNKPYWTTCVFRFEEINDKPVVSCSHRSDTPEYLGIATHLRAITEKQVDSVEKIAKGDRVLLLKTLLNIERQKDTLHIGCPVDVLILKKDKVVYRRDKC